MSAPDSIAAPDSRGGLRRSTLAAYSALELPVLMASTPIALFLPPFYTRDLGLRLSTVGLILMGARIWDMFTDPLIGALSDRTRSPLGRRRPWILAGTPVVMLSVYYLFMPAGAVSNAYFAFWVVLMWLGWTMVNIPYFAWGAELSSDYAERTRVTSVRTLFGLAGALTAIALPAIGERAYGYGGESGEVLRITGIAALCLFPPALLWLAWRVPEPPLGGRPIPLRRGLRIMWRNGPFRRLLFGFTVTGLGPALQAPVYILFVIHVVEEPAAGPYILLCFYAANFLGVALWGWLAGRIGKHRAWLCGMGVMVTATPCYLLLGPGDLAGMIAILFASGVGAGSFSAVPASMKADVIDLDTLRSGEDRAGVFFAAWSFASKLVVALGPGISFPLLEWWGFRASGPNGPDELLGLRIFFSAAPMLCYAGGFALVVGYPITAERHARLRALLERRAARRRRTDAAPPRARQVRDPGR